MITLTNVYKGMGIYLMCTMSFIFLTTAASSRYCENGSNSKGETIVGIQVIMKPTSNFTLSSLMFE
jgi:hypothetical protein